MAPPLRPQRKIVTLCGSIRSKQAYIDWNARLTLEGYIVLTVGLFEHADGALLTPAQKAGLDALHKDKIAMSDEILVLDVGGYIGDSTRSEIAFAQAHGIPVRYLSQEEPPS
jgi:hypothetical protein